MTSRAPIIGVLVAVLLAVAFYFLLWSPRNDELEAIRAETAELETRRTSLQNELRQLREIEANQVEFRAALARLEEFIPSGPAQATAVRQLQLAADASGVTISSLSFSNPEPVEEAPPTGIEETVLAAITVSAAVEGGYFQAVDFFRRLEVEVPRAVLLTNLSMVEAEEEFPILSSSWTGLLFAVVPQPGTVGVVESPAPATPGADEDTDADVDVDVDVEVEDGADAEADAGEPEEEETP